ncbi:hypothetical protein AB4851_14160 [Burkholderia sp. 22PA0099]|uniref:hypothetical protein n=1 Tax=Burkholderia sp. 22PA0099 TaxID=3237372 RepID=UPI0039C0462B
MTDNTLSARPDALRLATQYAALPEDKRALFRARARTGGIDTSALPAVPLAPRPARFPLLPAQERLVVPVVPRSGQRGVSPDADAALARPARCDGAASRAACAGGAP